MNNEEVNTGREGKGEEFEEVSFGEILANLQLSGQVNLTIFPEELSAIKTGLKNLKSREANKLREAGLPPNEEFLEFRELPSKEDNGCIILVILLRKKGVVKVRRMEIPTEGFL